MKIWYSFLPVCLFVLSCSPKKADQSLVNIAVKVVPETQFFCVAKEVTQAEIPLFAQSSIGPMYEALGHLGQPPAGDLQFICPQWKGPEARSTVVFAIPIGQEFPVTAPYYLWKAPAFKCAWIEYRGPMSGIKDAWMKFGEQVGQSGQKMGGSWREVYLHWVAPDSLENRTELQVGLE
jgi:hypothetical protein